MTVEETTAALNLAINAGEVLCIRYHGGSQPGAARDISPISIDGPKVRARCYTSNAVKLFVIDKIEICSGHHPDNVPAWDPTTKTKYQFASLTELHQVIADELHTLGWHVEHNDDFISLHRRWKNGKPLKGSEVSITYSEFVEEEHADLDEDGNLIYHETYKRRNARPYSVRARKINTRSFGIMEKAAELFMEQAKELAPPN